MYNKKHRFQMQPEKSRSTSQSAPLWASLQFIHACRRLLLLPMHSSSTKSKHQRCKSHCILRSTDKINFLSQSFEAMQMNNKRTASSSSSSMCVLILQDTWKRLPTCMWMKDQNLDFLKISPHVDLHPPNLQNETRAWLLWILWSIIEDNKISRKMY